MPALNPSNQPDHLLTVSCPDRKGVVHRISGLLLEHDGNIIDAQQFGDEQTGRFFLRVHFSLAPEQIEQLRTAMAVAATQFGMQWQIHCAAHRAKLLVLVSKQGHCLNDLLFRVHSGQLNAQIAAVVSNHTDFEPLVTSHQVPFYHLAVTPESKEAQEQTILELVQTLEIDLVVLARYMQILSPKLCNALSERAINIHHSFLPSFKGARPYYQAHERGVKLIGATAHYVTADLDEGPIIEQDIERVDHAMSTQDFARVGSDIESLVLARAVKAHIEHRIFLNGHRTVVFR
jgi:formyltetrahydrofolate deformylase